MPLYDNAASIQTLVFDGADSESFAPISNVPINTAISTVQSLIPFPYDVKIVRIAVAYTGTPTATAQFNIIYGVGAAATTPVGTVDTNAPIGTAVFATSPTIPTGQAGNLIVFFPDVPDVIYPSFNLDNRTLGTPQSPAVALSLRFITNGTGTLPGITQVTIGYKPVNQHMQATKMTTPAGNYGWDPSTF